jgi:hypothetical protein
METIFPDIWDDLFGESQFIMLEEMLTYKVQVSQVLEQFAEMKHKSVKGMEQLSPSKMNI